MEITKPAKLTETEFNQLETNVKQGLKTFLEVGEALERIRSSKAYKKYRGYSTFEDYVQKTFGLSKSQAYSTINAAKTALKVIEAGGKAPATAQEAAELGKALKELPDDQVRAALQTYADGSTKKSRNLLATGRKTLEGVKEAVRAGNRQKAIDAGKAFLDSENEPFQVVHADFRDFMATGLPEASVDLILTDIDYHSAQADYAEPFSKLAKRVLKPDGIAAVMLGNLTFDLFFGGLISHLPYRGQICYRMPEGKAATIHADTKRWNPMWKNVVVLGAAPDYVHCDIVESGSLEKPFFYMEQDILGFKRIIELLIRPGSRNGATTGMTILDCCCGTGTTMIAGLFAKSGPFKVIGCDIDAERVELSRARCGRAWKLMQELRDGDAALAAFKAEEAALVGNVPELPLAA